MNLNDPKHVALRDAIVAYDEVKARLAPLLAEASAKRDVLLLALGEVIVQTVEDYGGFRYLRQHGQKRWYREMPCSTIATTEGFEERITALFGRIEWHEYYRPALEKLHETKRAYYSAGMGDCSVLLSEKLTKGDMIKICAARKQRKNSP